MSEVTKGDDLAGNYKATRKSLIARLDNWEDKKAWDEFYKAYWKLIYSVALKAGLRSDEAFDVVQETILSIAKQSVKGMYKPEQGSFKSWLMNQTRWRINDQFRKRKKDVSANDLVFEDDRATSQLDRKPDKVDSLERSWDVEWKEHMITAALEKVKDKVSSQQYQIFYHYVIKEWEPSKVRDVLDVSMAQVYMAKHRVGSIFKKELKLLQDDDGK